MQEQNRFLEEHRTKANPGSFLRVQKTMTPNPLGMVPAASLCQLVNTQFKNQHHMKYKQAINEEQLESREGYN